MIPGFGKSMGWLTVVVGVWLLLSLIGCGAPRADDAAAQATAPVNPVTGGGGPPTPQATRSDVSGEVSAPPTRQDTVVFPTRSAFPTQTKAPAEEPMPLPVRATEISADEPEPPRAQPTDLAPGAPQPTTAAGAEPTAGATTSGSKEPSLAQMVQNEFAKVSTGQILYNPPEKMTVGQRERVEVRINFGQASPSTKGLEGTGPVQIEAIPVSQFMKVTLIGEAFEITELSSEEQVLVGDEFTEWKWDVVPKRGGEHSLTILVTARVKIEGYGEEKKDLETIPKTIVVEVTPIYSIGTFYDDNKEWLIPSVAIPLLLAVGGWGWRRFVRRRHGP